MRSNRRDFLAAAALAAPLGRLRGAEHNARPNIAFPSAPRDRLAVASWSFHELLDIPENRAKKRDKLIEMINFPAMVVDRYKIHNLELLGPHFPSTDAAYLRDLRAAVDRAGCRVINLPAGGRASIYDPDPGIREAAITDGKKWVDVAIALGSPSMRLNISGARNTKPNVELTAAGLSKIARYGQSKNIVVNLENDDPEIEDAFFIVKVIDRVNSPWLRALPDFCNSMLKGDPKFNYDAVEAMFHHAYNISHVKDSEVDNGKVFHTDVARTFGIAKAAGFKGYFSIEFEGEGDPYAGVAKLIEASLKYLG